MQKLFLIINYVYGNKILTVINEDFSIDIESISGFAWKVRNCFVFGAVSTLSAVLVAPEAIGTCTSKVKLVLSRFQIIKTYVKPISASVQTVLAPQVLEPSAHSSLRQTERPSPSNPSAQEHSNEPGAFVQTPVS